MCDAFLAIGIALTLLLTSWALCRSASLADDEMGQ
jgi:hypothetical protein